MIEFVKLYEIEQADQSVLYKKILYSLPCKPNSEDSFLYFGEMMKLISSNPEIYRCGPIPPQELVAKHDGEKWIFTFKALYEKKENV